MGRPANVGHIPTEAGRIRAALTNFADEGKIAVMTV
jgi:hypothetical protein